MGNMIRNARETYVVERTCTGEFFLWFVLLSLFDMVTDCLCPCGYGYMILCCCNFLHLLTTISDTWLRKEDHWKYGVLFFLVTLVRYIRWLIEVFCQRRRRGRRREGEEEEGREGRMGEMGAY